MDLANGTISVQWSPRSRGEPWNQLADVIPGAWSPPDNMVPLHGKA